MAYRNFRYLIVLLAIILTACEPSVDTIEPGAEVESAVEQIATAITSDDEIIIPTRAAEEAAPTTSVENILSPTPVETWTAFPSPTAVILSTPTLSAANTPIPTETRLFTASPAPTTTNTPGVPLLGVLPSPTPSHTQVAPQVIAPIVVDGEPPEIETAASDWPMANRDYANSRSVQNSNIFAANVNSLGMAWSYNITESESQYAPAGSPLIYGNTAYLQDLNSNVYALDVLSGSLMWRVDYNQPVNGASGAAIGYAKLYIQAGGSLRALALDTGEELWSTPLEGRSDAHQPYVFGELILTSTRQVEPQLGEEAASGWFYAIHHETGKVVWQKPAVQEDLWGDIQSNRRGGAWFPPAIDAARGLSYWGTGKIAALPGESGLQSITETSEGNIYSHSVVALSLVTGELMWAAPLEPNPRFGHGLEMSPLLVSLEREGEEPLEMVIGAGRAGRIIALDRDSGNRIWDIQVGRQQNLHLQTRPDVESIQILPGLYGGIASPLAYANGTLYAAVNHLPVEYTTQSEATLDQTPTSTVQPGRFNEGSSELIAVDAATGAVLWTAELPALNFGGATIVNDLVFTSTLDGGIYAFAVQNGDEIWAAQAPEGLLSPPAAAGDTLVMAALDGNRPFVFGLRLGLSVRKTPAPAITWTPTSTVTPTAVLSPVAPVTRTPTSTPTPPTLPTVTETETEEPTPLPTTAVPEP
jgi:outer membrane protein assembly factor BamB